MALDSCFFRFATLPPSRMITSCSNAFPSMVTEPNCVRSILGFILHLTALASLRQVSRPHADCPGPTSARDFQEHEPWFRRALPRTRSVLVDYANLHASEEGSAQPAVLCIAGVRSRLPRDWPSTVRHAQTSSLRLVPAALAR